MAAHTRYSTPAEQLAEMGVVARERGLSFEEFWGLAVFPTWPDGKPRKVTMRTDDPPMFAIAWPNDTEERKLWRNAIIGTKDAWREGYERDRSGRRLRGVRAIAPILTVASGLAEREAVASAA
jgi:hypothetical protein